MRIQLPTQPLNSKIKWIGSSPLESWRHTWMIWLSSGLIWIDSSQINKCLRSISRRWRCFSGRTCNRSTCLRVRSIYLTRTRKIVSGKARPRREREELDIEIAKLIMRKRKMIIKIEVIQIASWTRIKVTLALKRVRIQTWEIKGIA